MSQNFDFFCIGKSTVDQFLAINEFSTKCHLDARTGYLTFKHGEKIEVDKFEFSLGGNATNVAIGLSRLGLSAALCSETGEDEFAEKIRNWLDQEKIDRSHMIQTKSASSFSVILNFKKERTIFTRRIKRENELKFDDVSTKYLFLTSLDEGWRETYQNVLNFKIHHGFKLAFNPGTLQLTRGKDLVLKILEHTDILFLNKEEAEELVFGHEKRRHHNDREYIRSLLYKLQKQGAKIVVVTNGRYGSNVIDEEGNFYHEGLVPAEVIERTGAGDSYTAGFLAAIALGLSIKDAMKWGAVNSASVVEKIGAIEGLLSREEIEKRAGELQTVFVKEKPHLRHLISRALKKFNFKTN